MKNKLDVVVVNEINILNDIGVTVLRLFIDRIWDWRFV
jgi:hypothetical protein